MIIKSLRLIAFSPQTTLKMLEKSGVRNVVFTDCLKQRDENIRKVKCIGTSVSLFKNSASTLNMCLSLFLPSIPKLVPTLVEIIESRPRFNREEVSSFHCKHFFFYLSAYNFPLKKTTAPELFVNV